MEKLNQDYATYLNLCLQMKSRSIKKLMFNDFMAASEKMKQSVNNIYDVNMQAVVRKTDLTKHDSARFKKRYGYNRIDWHYIGVRVLLVFSRLYIDHYQLSFGQDEKFDNGKRHYHGHKDK